MVKQDLYIAVPSFFRCPISLDVMKSPVSLCTGVTYDRASIQRWLDGGNNTCPATMQVLPSKEFVRNSTLQRLIQIWSDSVQPVDSAESDGNSVISHEQLMKLVKQLELEKDSADCCYVVLSKIICFARQAGEKRDFLAKLDGFGNSVLDLMSNAVGDIKLNQLAIKVLDMMMNKVADRRQLMESMLKGNRDCLSAILLVLQRGCLDSQIESVRVLESVAIDSESKLMIAEKEGLLFELVKLAGKEEDPNSIEVSLSCLIALSLPKRVKTKLIQLGTIRKLRDLLREPSCSVSSTEKALKLLESLSSCKEGRLEICYDSLLVQAIVLKVLKVSNTATEHAVTVLWSVCYLFRDQKAQEAMAGTNGMTKILLLMQSNCTAAVKQMSADLLKMFRVNSKSCLPSYETKTTHIMPF